MIAIEDVVGAAEVELVLEQGMGSLNIFGSSSSSLAYSDMPYKRTVSKGLRNGKNEYHRENLHPPESNKRCFVFVKSLRQTSKRPPNVCIG